MGTVDPDGIYNLFFIVDWFGPSSIYSSSFTLSAIFYSYSSEELLSLNGNGWQLDLAFPIYLRVIPTDNKPSKFSYLFTPRLIFDTQDISLSQKKALYFDCKFNIFFYI